VPRREAYKSRLLKEKEALKKQISILQEGLQVTQGDSLEELSAYDNHPADIGSETYERGKDIGLLDNSRSLLKRVDEALVKLDNGTYGHCDKCGKPIPDERLAAVPHTSLCRECKLAQENQTRDLVQRPVEEKVITFTRSFPEADENVIFDREDSWQAVSRYSELPRVFYRDVGEDEDSIGSVEEVEKLGQKDYDEQW
jgi:DnaK suppressor protein